MRRAWASAAASGRIDCSFQVIFVLAIHRALMSQIESGNIRLTPQPLPDNLRSVQPGGGVCYQIELAWGRLRRWYLRTFRRGYVRRMAELRSGSTDGAPHEILDPRDLKYCRNQCDCDWAPSDDPFRWRERLPFARWGLAELQLMGYPLLALAIVGGWFHWWLAIVPAVLFAFVLYFFRDPRAARAPGAGAAGLAGRRHGGRSDASLPTTISSADRPCGSASFCRSSTCTSIARRPSRA